MKDKLAIAAVMSTIRAYLELRMAGKLAGLHVDATVLPPDKIPDDRNLVNLFLYDFRINAAFRNEPLPGRVRGLETGPPPLPLDLYFLLSAFAVDNADLNLERILGLAMSVLHDTPVLGPITISDGRDTYTYEHAERVRITPVQLTLDELTKIWTSFKGPLVPSMSYQVSVVLLESDLPANVPPPVLRRGDADRGPQAVGTPVPPFPVVEELAYGGTDVLQIRRHPRRQPVFERGDALRIRGTALAGPGGAAVVKLRPPGNAAAVVLPISAASTSEIAVRLDPAVVVQAGWHRLSVEIPTRLGRDPLRSQEVPVLVAPVIADLDNGLRFPRPAPHQPRQPQPLALRCDATLLPGQDVRLLIAGRDVPRSDPLASPTQDADFDVPEIPPGTYPVRLRVDGVDSLPLIVAGQLVIGKEVTVTHA